MNLKSEINILERIFQMNIHTTYNIQQHTKKKTSPQKAQTYFYFRI